MVLKGSVMGFIQGEAVQQLREALKILAERVLILEHMIGVHGKEKNRCRQMFFPGPGIESGERGVSYLLCAGESGEKIDAALGFVVQI